MSNRPSLDDYVDVAERIVAFKDQYPEGSLQTLTWYVQEYGERTFVIYKAAAFRTPTDNRPGHGCAWEPFPGKTPYTENSELMNAETAAWGRAIVALGITSKRSIASRQEVKARAGEHDREPAPTIPIDRAQGILAKAAGAGLAVAQDTDHVELKAVLIAKLVDVSGQQTIGRLNVDQAEALEAWIAKEARSAA
jgi:hypothetical protein